MPMIPRADAQELARQAVVLDLGDLARQGQAILQRAHERAQAIIEEAKAERQRLIEGAHQLGYQQGLEQGLAEGTEARVWSRARPRPSRPSARRSRPSGRPGGRRWSGSRPCADSCGWMPSDRCWAWPFGWASVWPSVRWRPTSRRPVASWSRLWSLCWRPRGCGSACARRTRRWYPKALPELSERLSGSAEVAVVEDDTLSPGSVVVEADQTRIDASIETQVARLAEAILPGGGP
ncbi:MAG: hypothetical protein KatS3mg103_0186 [Phycisphaerales bacterium]|nr:MAG: hypothetical protein KatS3mg103_0186 [Phycisphaerales bacterium]